MSRTVASLVALALAGCGGQALPRALFSPDAGNSIVLPGGGTTAGPAWKATAGVWPAGASGIPMGSLTGSGLASGGSTGGGSTGTAPASGGSVGGDLNPGSAPCAALLPARVPAPVTVTISKPDQTLRCLPTPGTDDGPGTLAVGELPSVGKTRWKFWSLATGALLTLATESSVNLPTLWAQPSGFAGLTLDTASGTQLLRSYSHAGQLVSSVLVQSDPSGSAAGAGLPAGGAVVIRGVFAAGSCELRYERYDSVGSAAIEETTVAAGLAPHSGTLRCPAPPYWLSLSGDALVFFAPGGVPSAEWVAPDGSVAVPPFEVPAIPAAMAALSDGSLVAKEPTAGGTAFWQRSWHDRWSSPSALPDWIAKAQPQAIAPIHGGQGYLATFPDPEESELFSADGTACGPAGIPAAVVGRDGSAVRQEGSCVYAWWPQLFPTR